jgi:protein-disulfide isomerase
MAATALLAGTLASACADSAWRGSEVLESSTTTLALAGADDPAVVAADAVTTPATGAKNPLVVVTVFSDFQCPACRQLPGLLEPLLLHYGGVLQIQYRQFPLEAMHRHARAASIAALAAHRQGQYTCFGRELYRTQDAWTKVSDGAFDTQLAESAKRCGLDVGRFEHDRKDPRLDQKVTTDVELARDLEVRATPTVWIDGLEMERRWRAGIHQPLRPNALIQRGIRDSEHLLQAGGELATIRAMRIEGNLGDGEKAARLLD